LAYEQLTGSFVNQKRFNVIEREKLEQILLEQKLSREKLTDPEYSIKVGRLMAADTILATSVAEDRKSVEFTSRVINTETSEIMEVKDVYSEDRSSASIKQLMDGLASKVAGSFPLVEDLSVKTDKETYQAKTVLVATGSHRRKLPTEGADKFEHKGLTYCATCDGPLFADMDVVVIGGGNAGFETAAQLLAYAKSVTLLNRSPEFKADPITVKKVLENPKMKAITNAETVEIKGDKFVDTLIYTDKESGEKHELKVSGIFVEIGLIPSTSLVDGLVELDKVKRIVVDPKNQQTSVDGVWAAGDCTNELYHQNNIAAGDAVKAIEDIYVYLKTR